MSPPLPAAAKPTCVDVQNQRDRQGPHTLATAGPRRTGERASGQLPRCKGLGSGRASGQPATIPEAGGQPGVRAGPASWPSPQPSRREPRLLSPEAASPSRAEAEPLSAGSNWTSLPTRDAWLRVSFPHVMVPTRSSIASTKRRRRVFTLEANSGPCPTASVMISVARAPSLCASPDLLWQRRVLDLAGELSVTDATSHRAHSALPNVHPHRG